MGGAALVAIASLIGAGAIDWCWPFLIHETSTFARDDRSPPIHVWPKDLFGEACVRPNSQLSAGLTAQHVQEGEGLVT